MLSPAVIVTDPVIDGVLRRYSADLGAQERMYRNHVYRCVNYHRLLLGRELPDTAVLAWAIHDLGIWTAGTMNYLEPSAALAEELVSEFGVRDTGTVGALVRNHHCVLRSDDELVETFRLADLADVSRGMLRGSRLRRGDVRRVVSVLPYLGFSRFLARKVLSNALVHPRKPLPMFRWHASM